MTRHVIVLAVAGLCCSVGLHAQTVCSRILEGNSETTDTCTATAPPGSAVSRTHTWTIQCQQDYFGGLINYAGPTPYSLTGSGKCSGTAQISRDCYPRFVGVQNTSTNQHIWQGWAYDQSTVFPQFPYCQDSVSRNTQPPFACNKKLCTRSGTTEPCAFYASTCQAEGYISTDYCTYSDYGCDIYSSWGNASELPGGDMNCCAFNTPIVIDIGGNGYHLTSLDGGVQFNVFSATKKALVAWTAAGSDNAWLVLDRNSNGLIDNSTELFGNFTPQPQSAQRNGFRALAVYDDPANGGNGNGLIDDGDTVFSTLRLWRDLNHNGIADPGELLTLDAAGIRSIDLHYKEKRWRDPNGNLFRYASTVLFKDGRGPRPIFDVVLQTLPQ